VIEQIGQIHDIDPLLQEMDANRSHLAAVTAAMVIIDKERAVRTHQVVVLDEFTDDGFEHPILPAVPFHDRMLEEMVDLESS
jgi:hypothetical protein